MNKNFTYKYSAKQNEEVKKIREKYEPPNEKEIKLEQLRKLDASVTNVAVTVSLIVGIVGSLILGFGMSCVMLWSEKMFVPGIIIGVSGIILTSSAYPVYKKILAERRKKIAPEILKLTDELIK